MRTARQSSATTQAPVIEAEVERQSAQECSGLDADYPQFGFDEMKPLSQTMGSTHTSNQGAYSPLAARTRSHHLPHDPVAFDCVKIIVVRAGSARVFSEFGRRHIKVGDVVVLAANTLCGAEPEGWITTTTLYLDRDYVIDQVYWQHAARFHTRHDASDFVDTHYAEPAQIVRVGEKRAGLLMPWLDELAALTIDGLTPEHFYRAQTCLFAVLDVVVPMLTTSEERMSSSQRIAEVPSAPRRRQFRASRAEARDTAKRLREQLDRRWTLADLAQAAHLSSSQLRRIFVEAFGQSPIAYLTMLRVQRMVELLRNTDAPIAVIAAEVGWSDPDFAGRQFRRNVGVSPSEYRRNSRTTSRGRVPE